MPNQSAVERLQALKDKFQREKKKIEWNTFPRELLERVSQDIGLSKCQEEIPLLKPKENETMDGYYRRFKDYRDVLDISDSESGLIFKRSLPEKFREQLNVLESVVLCSTCLLLLWTEKNIFGESANLE